MTDINRPADEGKKSLMTQNQMKDALVLLKMFLEDAELVKSDKVKKFIMNEIHQRMRDIEKTIAGLYAEVACANAQYDILSAEFARRTQQHQLQIAKLNEDHLKQLNDMQMTHDDRKDDEMHAKDLQTVQKKTESILPKGEARAYVRLLDDAAKDDTDEVNAVGEDDDNHPLTLSEILGPVLSSTLSDNYHDDSCGESNSSNTDAIELADKSESRKPVKKQKRQKKSDKKVKRAKTTNEQSK